MNIFLEITLQLIVMYICNSTGIVPNYVPLNINGQDVGIFNGRYTYTTINEEIVVKLPTGQVIFSTKESKTFSYFRSCVVEIITDKCNRIDYKPYIQITEINKGNLETYAFNTDMYKLSIPLDPNKTYLISYFDNLGLQLNVLHDTFYYQNKWFISDCTSKVFIPNIQD